MKIATSESLDSFGPFDVPDGKFLLRSPGWEDGREAPWDGYEPPCTLPLAPGETPLPVQKANLKPDATYRGIEAEGDEWMRLACDLARKSVERGAARSRPWCCRSTTRPDGSCGIGPGATG